MDIGDVVALGSLLLSVVSLITAAMTHSSGARHAEKLQIENARTSERLQELQHQFALLQTKAAQENEAILRVRAEAQMRLIERSHDAVHKAQSLLVNISLRLIMARDALANVRDDEFDACVDTFQADFVTLSGVILALPPGLMSAAVMVEGGLRAEAMTLLAAGMQKQPVPPDAEFTERLRTVQEAWGLAAGLWIQEAWAWFASARLGQDQLPSTADASAAMPVRVAVPVAEPDTTGLTDASSDQSESELVGSTQQQHRR